MLDRYRVGNSTRHIREDIAGLARGFATWQAVVVSLYRLVYALHLPPTQCSIKPQTISLTTTVERYT